MKIMSDFRCINGHVTEALRDDSVKAIVCEHCGMNAVKALAAPRSKLEGITGDFPDAYDRWERVRAEKLTKEQKQNS